MQGQTTKRTLLWLTALCSVLLLSVPFQPVSAAGSDAAGRIHRAYFYHPSGEGIDDLKQAEVLIFGLNDDKAVTELRSQGYQKPILLYFLAGEVEGPSTAHSAKSWCDDNKEPWSNNLANERGIFCREIHPHESWFLHNNASQRLQKGSDRNAFYMNIGNRDYQDWMIKRFAEVVAKDAHGFTGLFLDNVELSLEKVKRQVGNSDGSVREYQSDADYRDAWATYLRRLSERLRPQTSIWGNLIADPYDGSAWNDYLEYLDGAMSEAFAAGWPRSRFSVGRWERNLHQVEQALKRGKRVIGVTQGNANSSDLATFGFASSLLVAEADRMYYRYAKYADYGNWHDYKGFDVQLGAPLGDRYQRDGQWRRDFERGYVTVNPDTLKATIRTTDTEDPPEPVPSAPNTYTFALERDATVVRDEPTTSYGTASDIIVDGSPEREIYLAFTIRDVPGSIQSVKLRVFCTAGGGDRPSAQRTSSKWNENDITWNNRPRRAGDRVSTGSSGAGTGKWLNLDFSDLVKRNGTYGIVLSLDSADSLVFAARESSTPPQIIVTTK